MTRCSTSGTESAITSAITIATGDGPIMEDNQLCGSVQGITVDCWLID